MLYTGEQIAEKYSTEEIKLSADTIRRWANKGLKHIKGSHNKFLYKEEWVEEYLELEAERNVTNNKITKFNNENKPKRANKIRIADFENCKVV